MWPLLNVTPEGKIALFVFFIILLIVTFLLYLMKKTDVTDAADLKTVTERIECTLSLLKSAKTLSDVEDAERYALRSIKRSEILDSANEKDIDFLNRQFKINWELFKGKSGFELNLYSHIKSLDIFLDEVTRNVAHYNTLNPVY